jgi:hypothetical protein
MEVDNQSTKHWWMDTTYPIKEMKIKSSQTKFIIKTFTSTCVAKILPKLRLQDEQLWKILNSTNANNLHAHEVAKKFVNMNPILSKSSSFSYIQSIKKITHFSCSFKRWSWSSSCLNYMSLFKLLFELFLLISCFERLCVKFSLHLLLFSIVFLLL